MPISAFFTSIIHGQECSHIRQESGEGKRLLPQPNEDAIRITIIAPDVSLAAVIVGNIFSGFVDMVTGT